MNIENPKNPESVSPLAEISGNGSIGKEGLASLNSPIDSPYSSGFDAEHPMPSYEQLRNAGFSEHVANQILNGGNHCYSQKELFQALYSENPLQAYNDMMHAKGDEIFKRSEELINGIQKEFGIYI